MLISPNSVHSPMMTSGFGTSPAMLGGVRNIPLPIVMPTTGAVSACAIAGDTGALTRLDEQPSEGNAPCFVSVDKSGRVVLVANYEAGTVALLPIETGGALARATSVVQHTGHGPNADRQSA